MKKNVCIFIVFLLYGLLSKNVYGNEGLTYGIIANPSIGFVGSLDICGSDSVKLFIADPPNGASYQWRKDGRRLSADTLNFIWVSKSGDYSCDVISGNNTIKVDAVTVNVFPLPSANFSFPNINGCGKSEIKFTNLSNPNGSNSLSYKWNFGDNSKSSTSSQKDPTHTFIPSKGTGSQSFTVKLIVTGDGGCSDSVSKIVNIGKTPDATLYGEGFEIINDENYFKICSPTGETFNFFNNSTTKSSNTNYIIRWGDGSNNFEASTFNDTIQHDYSVGLKRLSFIVYSGTCVDSTVYNVFVGNIPAGGIAGVGGSTICSGDAQKFVITNWKNNPPGTKYHFYYNDGSLPDSFYTVQNDTISHTFLRSSCGTNINNPVQILNNYFSATLTITNPCGTAIGSILPIYVSDKPDAEFIVSKDSICEGQTIKFTSVGFPGNNVQNGKCTSGKRIWRISALDANGNWIVSGSLGSTGSTSNPNNWTSGDSIVNITFLKAGLYKVIHFMANNTLCGSDTAVRFICVNPTPTASFTLDKNTGCLPLKVVTTNTSVLPNCGQNSYAWKVTYAPLTGCLPSTINYNLLNGTSLASANPEFQFNNPGIYTLTLITTNPGGACVSTPYSAQVMVRDKPLASFTAASVLCLGQSLTVTPSASCDVDTAKYQWDFEGGTPLTASVFNPGQIAYANTGIFSVKFSATNGCGTTISSSTLTVKTVTESQAGPAQMICGPATTMSANNPTLGSGVWTHVSGPNVPTIEAPGSYNTRISGLVVGDYVFRWTITNTPCSSSSTVNVKVIAGPSIPNAGPDQSLCLTDSAVLSGNSPAIGTGAWVQSGGPSTVTISDPAALSPKIKGMVAGTYSFKWLISYPTCTTLEDVVVIQNFNKPSPSNAGNDTSICTPALNLKAELPASGSGVWKLVSGPSAVVFGDSKLTNTLVSNLVPGVYKFSWIVSNGPCAVSEDTVDVTVDPKPTVANAGPDIALCKTTTANLAANLPAVGKGAWTQISGPTKASFNDTSIHTPALSNLQVGVYRFRWTISNGTCPVSLDEIDLTINDSASRSFAGILQEKCGNTIFLAADSPVVGSGKWSLVSGTPVPSFVNPTSPTSQVTGLQVGTYVFQWTVTNGACSNASQVSIKMLTGPTVSNAGPDQQVCNLTQVTMNANSPAVGTGKWTQVSGPNTADIVDVSSPTTIMKGLVAGNYVFRWSISFSNCTPSNDDVNIVVNALPDSSKAGPDQQACISTVTLAANQPLVGTGAWSLVSTSNGSPLPAFTPTVYNTIVTSLKTGLHQFRWIITNGVCPATVDTVQIKIDELPTVANAGVDQALCQADSTLLAGNSPTLGTGQWSQVAGPAGAVIQSPSAPNSKITGLKVGNYVFRWTISNGTCASSSDDVNITVYDAPSKANASLDQEICTTETTLNANSPSIGVGTWFVVSSPSSPVYTPSDAKTKITSLKPGIYKLRWEITNGVCPASNDTVVVQVDENPTPANAGADLKICNQDSVQLGATALTVGEGLWSLVSGSAVNFKDPKLYNTIVKNLAVGSYRFKWTTSNKVCNATSDEVLVDIFEQASKANAGTDQEICGTTALMAAEKTTVGTGTWTLVSGPSAAGFDDHHLYNTKVNNLIPGTYVFRWTVENGSCLNFDEVNVVVFSGPTAAQAGADIALCNLSKTNLQANTPLVGTGKWSLVSGRTDVQILNSEDPFTAIENLKTGTYVFRWTISFSNCTASFDEVSVTVYDIPSDPSAGNDSIICASYYDFKATVPTVGIGQWLLLSSPSSISIQDPAKAATKVTGLMPGIHTFRWNVSNGVCPSKNDTLQITVTANPSAADAGKDQSLCATDFIDLNATAPAIGSGRWTLVSGPEPTRILNADAPATKIEIPSTGKYQFKWTVSNGVCPSTLDEIVVDVFEKATPPDAGKDQIICGNSALMAANDALIGQGAWSLVSGPSAVSFVSPASGQTTVNGLVVGTYVFRWTIANGVCSNADEVMVTVIDGPTKSNAGPDQFICQTTTVLSANIPSIGTGKWEMVSGPATGNISNPLSNTSAISDLQPGDYLFQWVIAFGNCSNSVDEVKIKVYDLPSKAEAGIDQVICTSATLMSATQPVFGTGTWTFISGPNTPTIQNANKHDSYVEGLIPGKYIFQWTIANGNCSLNADQVTIEVSPKPSKSNAGRDQVLCFENQVSLLANTPDIGLGKWELISGPTALSFASPNTPAIVVGPLKAGQYLFKWEISNSVCPVENDTVKILNLDTLVNKIDLTPVKLCEAQLLQIAGEPASGGNGTYTYYWQTSFDGQNWQTIPNAQTQNLTLTVFRSQFVRRVVESLPCISYSVASYVEVQSAISGNTIAASHEICINTPAKLLKGEAPAGGDGSYLYQWQFSENGGLNWTDIVGATLPDYDPGVLVKSSWYRRKVATLLCSGDQASFSNLVEVKVNPDAVASVQVVKDTACWPFAVQLENTSPHAIHKQYDWYAGQNFIGSGQSFPGYTLQNPDSKIVIKMIAISKFGCRPDSASHLFVTYPKPAPEFVKKENGVCGPMLVRFTNTTNRKLEFRYKWDFGNGLQYEGDEPAADIVFLPNPSFGDTTYYVKLYAFNQCDTQMYELPVLVKSRPKAIFTPDISSGCSPFPVKFFNGAQGVGMTYKWIFGDGAVYTTTDPSPLAHVYKTGIQTIFKPQLIASNVCGTDTFSMNLQVAPNKVDLKFAIDGATVNGCAPHAVRIINNSSGANLFQWNFGDGQSFNSTANKELLDHTYLKDGDFEIFVRASNGCSDTATKSLVHVYRKPIPDFEIQGLTRCIGDSLLFLNHTDTASSYTWNFGDGSYLQTKDASHFYKSPGIYPVSLVSSLQFATGQVCYDSVFRTVSITDHLPGLFLVSDSVLNCQPFEVSFQNGILPVAESVWDFGDGHTAIGDKVQHRYASNGNYRVRLTAKDQGGCTYDFEKEIKALSPAGKISYAIQPICDDAPLRFDAEVVATDSIRWDFGDGFSATTTEKTVYHKYLQPGVYLPKALLISGKNGACTVPLIGSDSLHVDRVKAGFFYNKQLYCEKTLLNFEDSSIAYSGIATYNWDFADGTMGSFRKETHAYNSSSTYSVIHSVTSKFGCKDTTFRQLFVKVNNRPTANITAALEHCLNDSVILISNVQSEDSVHFYKWTISNGIVAYGKKTAAVFSKTGNYQVKLIASTINSCYDTTEITIGVHPLPFVHASDDKRICKGQSVSLLAEGSDNYLWSPTEGLSCTNCPDPIGRPQFSTSYVVATVTPFGCKASDTVNIEVVQPFKMEVSKNDTLCIGQSTQLSVGGADSYVWAPSASLSCKTCTNPVAKPDITTNYRVVGYDRYNCFTDTGFVVVAVGNYPMVSLGKDQLLSTGTLWPLKSDITYGPIRTYTWTPVDNLNCKTCSEPIAQIKQDICYSLEAKNIYGCAGKDTVCIKVFCQSSQVYIPNAFTPDGDGKNDVFMVRATGIRQVKRFAVFNRWGEIVFEQSNFLPNDPRFGWDGRVRGVKLTSDVFVYIAEVECDNDVKYSYKGNVSLLN